MTLSLALDILVAVLLVATIGYAAVLNRRLGALRKDKEELEALVSGLTVAAQRAETGVAELRQAAEDVGAQLQKRIDQAHSLREDLTYMIDRGGSLADRIEGTLRARRDEPAEEPVSRGRAAVSRNDMGRNEGARKDHALRSEPGLRLEPMPPSPKAGSRAAEDEEAELGAARRAGGSPASRSEIDLHRALTGRR